MKTSVAFDVHKLEHDIASRGWLPADLARAAGVSKMTVYRVLQGERANPRTCDRLARSLGYSIKRYLRKAA